MRLKRLLPILAALVSLTLAVILAYLLKDAIRHFLIAPLIYTYRFFRIIYEALPQVAWWVVFLLLLVLLAVRSILRYLKFSPRLPGAGQDDRLSRARCWSHWLQVSRQGDYSRWLLARNIAKLALEILAHQERRSLEQTRQLMQAGKIHLPPEVHAYLRVGLDAPSFRHYSEFLNLLRSTRSASPLDLDPEVVIRYLETRIESGGSL
jgi:hypothetical protein